VEQLQAAGVRVFASNDTAARYAGQLVARLDPGTARSGAGDTQDAGVHAVDLHAFKRPLAAINVGLESFTESLAAQGARAIQVDWRPPASGDDRLMAILERMKGK
jgi:FdrA protein